MTDQQRIRDFSKQLKAGYSADIDTFVQSYVQAIEINLFYLTINLQPKWFGKSSTKWLSGG